MFFKKKKKPVKMLESKKSFLGGPKIVRSPKRQGSWDLIEGRSQPKLSQKKTTEKVGASSGYSKLRVSSY